MALLTTTVTSLQISTRPQQMVPPPALPEPVVVEEVPLMPLPRYRALYRAVGEAHHWTSRLLSDEALRREIHGPAIRIFVATSGAATIGWFEIETRPAIGEARIVHLGVMPEFRGRGLAGFLLSQAIQAGFSEGISCVSIETNTLDHPAALPLYLKHGFQPFATRQVQTPAINPAPARASETTP
ncbi:GNAT family N-acetyltransferase [Aurantimonas aggregata]|uniref:GNAT family N-acetyltransferase n=1 Tax=Aurantimonas aggregata TaxID=2047720 RepID=A0A6L9MMA2_9HYPH|nr:GNAT family N-acetyltransferase [Aurantimonas aggregata]NDV88756.1 GNAT family N-acetyltransferase [Aurantimonas aggregata]